MADLRRRDGDALPARLIVAVSLLAVVISAVNIGHVSMWSDEAASLSAATRSWSDVWRLVTYLDAVHAVYYAMLHPWLAVVGSSAVTLRLPSVLAVGAATAGVLILTRQLTTARAAVAAGLTFAVLPRITGTAIEGRPFALTATVAVWLTVLLVSLVRQPTAGKLVAYTLLAAFGIWLNIFLALLLVAHGLTLLLHRGVRFQRPFWLWLAAGMAAALSAVPVVLEAVSQSGQIGETQYGPAGYVRAVLINQWFLGNTPTIFLSGTGQLIDGPGAQLWKPAAVLLALVCWALIAYTVLRRPTPSDEQGPLRLAPLMIAWAAVPTLALVGYSLLATPLYNPRYLTFASPAIAVLLGVGLVRLGRLPGWRGWLSLLVAAGIILCALPVFASQRTVYAKGGADWKVLAAFVAERRGPDQAVYYAPRTGEREARGATSRTAEILYPDAFAGLRDLTVLGSPAAEANLYGRSQPLTESGDRLSGIDRVFVLRRRDYPVDVTAAEDTFLAVTGFAAGERWQGPQNTVTVFDRCPTGRGPCHSESR